MISATRRFVSARKTSDLRSSPNLGMKTEPDWMRSFRLSLKIFESKPLPTWGGKIDIVTGTHLSQPGDRRAFLHYIAPAIKSALTS